jgi:hypothetical protein
VFHWNAERVRAHVFLCMLAYYVEWHMREKLKPMLFDDECVEQARASRPSPVAKAQRSDQAKAKHATRLGEDGLPVHSFRTLLDDLATLTYNVCHTPLNPNAKIVMSTRPTPVQEKQPVFAENRTRTMNPDSAIVRSRVVVPGSVAERPLVHPTPVGLPVEKTGSGHDQSHILVSLASRWKDLFCL